jgi:hypothetical protein
MTILSSSSGADDGDGSVGGAESSGGGGGGSGSGSGGGSRGGLDEASLQKLIADHAKLQGGADTRADWQDTNGASGEDDPADYTGRSPHPVGLGTSWMHVSAWCQPLRL